MAPTADLKRLCESWWEQLANSAKDRQVPFAEQFLEWFGWDEPTPIACPGDITAHASVVSYLLQQGPHGVAAAHFVLPGMLKPPAAVLELSLDFCDATRALVNATRAMNVRYAFVSDLFRMYLYDTVSEDLLLTADTPADIVTEFADVLDRSRVQEGSLEEVRRHPRSHVARQFREWSNRWCGVLAMEWQASEELTWLAMDRLVLLRYMADRNALARPGWQLRQRYLELLASVRYSRSQGAGQALMNLFGELWSLWHAEMFAPDPRLDAILEQDAVAAPLLREFGLLARSKFQLLTLLETFNFGEAAEKARVRMIPEANEERMTYLSRQSAAAVDRVRLELDLQDEGYRAILYWFDQVIALYDRLGREYDRQQEQRHTCQDGPQDLFAWSEADAGRPQAFQDPLEHAVGQGLVVFCSSSRQRRIARLLLHLHVIDHYAEAKTRIVRFPKIEGALRPRPRMLESDRRSIYQPAHDSEWEAI